MFKKDDKRKRRKLALSTATIVYLSSQQLSQIVSGDDTTSRADPGTNCKPN